jgi:hypothetical protein
VERIEELITWKGAFELAYLLENTNDAPYKYEVYDILTFCFDNYKEENGYILKYLNSCSPTEETNDLKEPIKEDISETGSSLDEKEEESDDQVEEEWSYPCLPPNKSNSLSNTLFDSPPCLTKEGKCDIYIVEFVHDGTCNTPLLLTISETLSKYLISGKLKTFAKQCACVLFECMIPCVCASMCDFM